MERAREASVQEHVAVSSSSTTTAATGGSGSPEPSNRQAAAVSARKVTSKTFGTTARRSTLKRAVKSRDILHLYSSLVGGVASGALASVLCAPIDLIRTRLQVWGDVKGQKGSLSVVPNMMRDIIAREGYKGCFRGLGATLVTVPAFWGVYFPLYDDFKRHWSSEYPEMNPAWIHMGSAVLAGAISDIICNPMFVVRTRIQTDFLHGGGPPKSMLETARSLYAEGQSPLIFWRGMTANLIGLSHVAVQFPVYEKLKKKFRGQHKEHETPLDLLLASGLSKMVASFISYPHEVVRSRMMDSREKSGLRETCRRIYRSEGYRGFYAGLPISLLRVIPNTCITFMTYELFCRWSRNKMDEIRRQSS